jgi:eukaryotic-like serine/threonine-protein kinase
VSSRPDPEPGLLLAGRYHLRRVLGRGGAGTVWSADDDLLDRPVAVKLLHPELERDASAVARFRREATAAAALTHPNAVIVYDIGEDEGREFLVMEYVDGVTLSELLADGQLAPDDVATIGVSVARALGAAHRRGLVHRDVKPGNVLINREGVAKVVDFGIATALGDAQARLTVPGMVVGTSAYLAPEQLAGEAVDARADVYSLGLVLHECLTGQPVFSGGTAVEVATRRLTGEVPAPSELAAGIPEELDLAIRRATRREPEHRFEDAAAFAEATAPLLPAEASARLARLVASRIGPAEPTRPRTSSVEDPTLASPAAMPAPQHAGTRASTASGPDESATTAIPRTSSSAPAAAARTSTLPATAEVDDAEDAPPRRSRWQGPLPWMLGLVVLALFTVAILDVIQGDPEDGDGEQQGDELATLAVQDGGDFDPFGDGEHPQDVDNAFDGNPDTTWQTQRYNSANLGGLKPGVGMWVDLGEPSTVARIDLALQPEGAELAVYAANDAPPTGVGSGWEPGEWGTRIAEASSAASAESFELDEVEARYVLLWFTSLPPDGGGHRVHVSDITVAG